MEGADDSTEPLRQPKITRLLDRNISNYQRRIGQSLSQRGKSNGLLHNLRRVPHQQTVQVLLHEEAALPPAPHRAPWQQVPAAGGGRGGGVSGGEVF